MFKGKVPFEEAGMSLTNDGFEIEFTDKVDKKSAMNKDAYVFQHYYYEYTHRYGGPQRGKTKVPVKDVEISDDGFTVNVTLGEMVNERIYQLDLKGIKDKSGRDVVNPLVCYTINRLRK